MCNEQKTETEIGNQTRLFVNDRGDQFRKFCPQRIKKYSKIEAIIRQNVTLSIPPLHIGQLNLKTLE
jgi:hypothetical protein